jgi:hypothetical protein
MGTAWWPWDIDVAAVREKEGGFGELSLERERCRARRVHGGNVEVVSALLIRV